MLRLVERLKELGIVLFGYAIGLSLQAGFNPQGGVFAPLEVFISTNVNDLYVRSTLAIVLLLVLGLSVRKAFRIGGPASIIAVAMGFLAGLATPTDLIVGPAMLLLAGISAWISVQRWRTLKGPQG
ncbi:MAG TPA: hypothetical protein VEI51_00475 [Methanomicrobiales archaeon]|nr:hypothetical protein [Methanomicrobiales archaeon]